jgi:Tol biopolymer transport system component
MMRKANGKRARTARAAEAVEKTRRRRRWLLAWTVGGCVSVLILGILLYRNVFPGGRAASASLPASLGGVLTYQYAGNIYELPLDSKAERKLTNFPPANSVLFSTRSPDGGRVAYVRITGMGSSLWLMNADGSGERKLVEESTGYVTLERPQWAPDGSAILYSYHGFIIEGGSLKGETFRAEQVDPETGERTPLAQDAEGPTLAPDGSLAFVRTTREGQQLVLLEPSGTERILVTERMFVSLAAPRFSLDGRRIAFTAVGDGPKVGGPAPAHEDQSLPWSAVLGAVRFGLETRIAYAHGAPAKVWIADVSGGVRGVGNLAEDEPTLAWSADGQYLAVSGSGGVYIVDVASGQPHQLAKLGGFGGIDWTR